MRSQPVRNERAEAEANAFLLARYPHLVEMNFTRALPFVGELPRPACARLFRIGAALACSRSLRRVVTGSAHVAFARNVAPHVLRAVQLQTSTEQDDLELGASLNLFDRRSMTAAGLALSLRALADGDAAQYLWLQLRMPRDVADDAARFNARSVSPAAARELIGNAWKLLRGEPC
jgi:hypothetical protein